MKKLFSILLVFVMMFAFINAHAMDLGDLGGLLDTLSQDDPDIGDVMDGLSSFMGGSKSTESEKKADTKADSKDESDEELPSLVGPFSGDTVKVKAGKKTYTVHTVFKDAMDKYEAYFDAYIEFMSHMDAPDYFAKYADFMKKYAEVSEALEKLDKMSDKEKGWTKDEEAYYTYVLLEIDKKLYASIGSMN